MCQQVVLIPCTLWSRYPHSEKGEKRYTTIKVGEARDISLSNSQSIQKLEYKTKQKHPIYHSIIPHSHTYLFFFPLSTIPKLKPDKSPDPTPTPTPLYPTKTFKSQVPAAQSLSHSQKPWYPYGFYSWCWCC